MVVGPVLMPWQFSHPSQDETFFQTVLVNTHFCTRHVPTNFHVHYREGFKVSAASKAYTDIAWLGQGSVTRPDEVRTLS